MDLELKVSELKDEIAKLKGSVEQCTLKIKLLSNTLRSFEKLLEKAKELEK